MTTTIKTNRFSSKHSRRLRKRLAHMQKYVTPEEEAEIQKTRVDFFENRSGSPRGPDTPSEVDDLIL